MAGCREVAISKIATRGNFLIASEQEPTMSGQQDFPTVEQVNKASKEQLAKWYRFLLGTTDEQRKTLHRVARRLKELGGMSPELSKKIGH